MGVSGHERWTPATVTLITASGNRGPWVLPGSPWLPGKKINLALSTWDGYRRKIDRHILPAIGNSRIRRLRAHHLETIYDRMRHPTAAHWTKDRKYPACSPNAMDASPVPRRVIE